MTTPITPDEVVSAQQKVIPNEVFAVFNTLIAKNWDGTSSTVKQKIAVSMIADKLDCTRQAVFDNKYVNIEDVYREAGWKVHYDKPGYNESYEATFEFSKE